MQGNIKIKNNEVFILCKEEKSATFIWSFLIQLGSAIKICQAEEVLLQVENGSPLSSLFEIGDIGTINLFLAPLIQDEK